MIVRDTIGFFNTILQESGQLKRNKAFHIPCKVIFDISKYLWMRHNTFLFFQHTNLRDQWYRMGNKCVKKPAGNELKNIFYLDRATRFQLELKNYGVDCLILGKRIVSGEKLGWGVLPMTNNNGDLKIILQHCRYLENYI